MGSDPVNGFPWGQIRSTVHGPRSTVHGPRSTVHGVIHGVIHGVRSGKRSMGRVAPGITPWGSHRSGCEEQNARLVTPGQIPPTRPIIGLPALLRLVEWYQDRRRNTQQGGLPCVNLETPLSPPAPQRGKSSTDSTAAVG